MMAGAGANPQVVAFVWDTPLLFETGLNRACDAVVFVEAPFEQRLARVKTSRGWEETELLRRQNLQWGLDKKREMSDHRVTNTADDVGDVRDQVRATLSRILAGTSVTPGPRPRG
jgi:dephospho-CoA kinase